MAPEIKPENTFFEPQFSETLIKQKSRTGGKHLFAAKSICICLTDPNWLKEQLSRVFFYRNSQFSWDNLQQNTEHKNNANTKGQVNNSPKLLALGHL